MSKSTKANSQPTSPTSFRLDDNLKEALKTIADRESRSMANTIEWLAKGYFKKNKLTWPDHQNASIKNEQED